MTPSFFIEILLEGLPISSSGHIALLSNMSQFFAPLNQIDTHLTHAIFFLIQMQFLLQNIIFLWNISFLVLIKTAVSFVSMFTITFFIYSIYKILLYNTSIEIPLFIGFLTTTLFLIIIKYLNNGKSKQYYLMNKKEILFLGMFQIIAFIPGISRFATMLLGSLLCGFKKENAINIALISNTCISIASIFFLIIKHSKEPIILLLSYAEIFIFIIVFSLSFILLTAFLYAFRKNKISIFIYYELIISIISIYNFII